MIELSGLRRYAIGEATVRLEADIKFTDMDATCPAETIYFEIDKEFGGMFVNDTYDPFVFVPLYLAMHYKTDLRIHGNISKKFYKNLKWYIQKILCDFNKKLSPVDIIADGFSPTEAGGFLTGTGISCGVDSLSTIYDRFVKEDDPDYKINALFMFNCGSHGDFGKEETQEVFISRIMRSNALAEELGLLLIVVDSNLHQFRLEEDKDTVLFLSFYSCVLSMQNGIRRYYIPGACSYKGIKEFGDNDKHHADLAVACDSFLIPLIQTERTELIIDGCQYRRVDKIKNIADWDIAQRYLNVCLMQKGADSTNCGACAKCMRTLLTLEILGKLDNFAQIFNLAQWNNNSFHYKAATMDNADKEIFFHENVELAAENNFPMPVQQSCYTLDKQVVIFDDEQK